MAVNLSGSLPKDDLNGLASIEWSLVSEAQRTRLVIGVVCTDSIKRKIATGNTEPTVAFVQVEPVTEEVEDRVRKLLVGLYQERTGRAHLDFPDEDSSQEPEEDIEDAVLELEQGEGYEFVVGDQPAGRFSLRLLTATGTEVAKRGNLLRSEHGDIPPGEYQQVHLPESLQKVAEVLISEWEHNDPARVEDGVFINDDEIDPADFGSGDEDDDEGEESD